MSQWWKPQSSRRRGVVRPPRVPGVQVASRPACKTIYGAVYRARPASLRGDVALKVYDAQAASRHSGCVAGGFVQVPECGDTEVTVLAQARARPHPNLMAAHSITDTLRQHGVITTGVADACRAGKPLVTATTWCDGGDVYTEVDRVGAYDAYVPVRDVRRMFVHAARGVAHLHSLGWAHMDVSLENLLLTRIGTDSRVVLTDFGLCLPLHRTPHLTCRRGKSSYASPEALLMPGVTAKDLRKCDVYSLGICLFTMLAGCSLYAYVSDAAFGYLKDGKVDVLVAAWHKGARFDRGALDLVQRMLAFHPCDRPSMAQVLAHPWCRGVPGCPPTAAPPAHITPPVRTEPAEPCGEAVAGVARHTATARSTVGRGAEACGAAPAPTGEHTRVAAHATQAAGAAHTATGEATMATEAAARSAPSGVTGGVGFSRTTSTATTFTLAGDAAAVGASASEASAASRARRVSPCSPRADVGNRGALLDCATEGDGA